MILAGMMACRNEAWILGLSARVALQWCDLVVIREHGSDEHATSAVMSRLKNEFAGRIFWYRDSSNEWDEMRHREFMLNAARSYGATHMAIIDADELLSADLQPYIRREIEQLEPLTVLQLPIFNFRFDLDHYHSNGIWYTDQDGKRRKASLAFKDDPALSWTGDTFHHREPFGATKGCLLSGPGGILHFWGIPLRRLLAKQNLYKMTERIRWPEKLIADINQYYSLATDETAARHLGHLKPWTYAAPPAEWMESYKPLIERYLDLDAEPWQIAECERLMNQYGQEYFAGLELFRIPPK